MYCCTSRILTIQNTHHQSEQTLSTQAKRTDMTHSFMRDVPYFWPLRLERVFLRFFLAKWRLETTFRAGVWSKPAWPRWTTYLVCASKILFSRAYLEQNTRQPTFCSNKKPQSASGVGGGCLVRTFAREGSRESNAAWAAFQCLLISFLVTGYPHSEQHT